MTRKLFETEIGNTYFFSFTYLFCYLKNVFHLFELGNFGGWRYDIFCLFILRMCILTTLHCLISVF